MPAPGGVLGSHRRRGDLTSPVLLTWRKLGTSPGPPHLGEGSRSSLSPPRAQQQLAGADYSMLLCRPLTGWVREAARGRLRTVPPGVAAALASPPERAAAPAPLVPWFSMQPGPAAEPSAGRGPCPPRRCAAPLPARCRQPRPGARCVAARGTSGAGEGGGRRCRLSETWAWRR